MKCSAGCSIWSCLTPSFLAFFAVACAAEVDDEERFSLGNAARAWTDVVPMASLGGRNIALLGDIDGDDELDVVIGDAAAGFGTCSPSAGWGEISVWYGEYGGAADETWDRADSGVNGTRDCGDQFGASVAIGDFDADGYDDVAIGVPGDAVDGANSGSVHVMYGSDTGLVTTGNTIFSQDSTNVEGMAEAYDAFGTAVVAGDFDCDGYADLAIGAPGEAIGELSNAGAVNVLYGSASGISATDDQLFHQDISGILDDSEVGDHFGAYLAAGNLDGNVSGGFPCFDLAVGVPDEDVGSELAAGSVNVIYGSSSGLSSGGNQFWNQASANIEGTAVDDDQFGTSVQIFDYTEDGMYDDLVCAIPGESTHGSISVIVGGSSGATSANDLLFPIDTEEGWVRDACYWACNAACLLLPPGPTCDCSACELLTSQQPCPGCA
jgi:hypothetical protein